VASCPNGELVDAMRAEKLLAVAAGDNVVRLLPPLIIEEPDIADAIDRIDRAAGRIERAQLQKSPPAFSPSLPSPAPLPNPPPLAGEGREGEKGGGFGRGAGEARVGGEAAKVDS
jgi:hypothetical protein